MPEFQPIHFNQVFYSDVVVKLRMDDAQCKLNKVSAQKSVIKFT